MEYITFKQFIYTINIRDYYVSSNGTECHDNKIIRIYYDFNNTKKYIDLGWYDYYSKGTVWEVLESTLNKKILDSVITDIGYNEDYSILEIWTEQKENLTETLKEFQN